MMADKQGSHLGWFKRWFSSRAQSRKRWSQAFAHYGEVVSRAREPVLYDKLNVPDTHDGRFEAIGLETALLMRRLRRMGDEGSELAQEIFDIMFKDMDRSVREQGVGDLSVGKYVKRMASSFLARVHDIEGPLDRGSAEDLEPLLGRFFHDPGASLPMRSLADYMIATDRAYAALSDDDIRAGSLAVPRAGSWYRDNH